MAHVTVTIAGRPYRMACGDGEEPHLEELARTLERKITELRGSFGEIGDQRITVMAALTLADELVEARKRIAALEEEKSELQLAHGAAQASSDGWTDSVAQALSRAAARIERVSHQLGGAAAKEAAGIFPQDGEPAS
ncbi:MAG: cell division protein ZapA [Methylobacteriaceae bacterium]|nr:cell division protein ZapA [Methylobacteriaceae bacterium]